MTRSGQAESLRRSAQPQRCIDYRLRHVLSLPRCPRSITGLVAALGAAVLAAAAPPSISAQQTTATSSAFGESVTLSLARLVGSTINVTSPQTPLVTASAPPSYDLTQSVASVDASGTVIGSVLSTGVIDVHAASPVPGSTSATADTTVHDLALNLVGGSPLLALDANTVTSSATISGTCGAVLTRTGTTTITGAALSGLAAVGVSIGASIAPNTTLINTLGVHVVLNEQISTGNGTTTAGLTVNAIHITVTNGILNLLGTLNADIIIGQSAASLQCGATPTVTQTPTRTPTHTFTATRTPTATSTATNSPCAPVPAAASSSAYGERVDLDLTTLVHVGSGPLPLVSGSAPPAYNLSDTAASASAGSGLTGQILQTGVLNVTAQSTVPVSGAVSASAEVNDLDLDLVSVLNLLGLGATTVRSTAAITGCTGNFTVTGSTVIEGASVSGPLGTGVSIGANPAPNTEISLANGTLRIILNEQIPSGSPATNPGLTVNAIHIILNALDLGVLGDVSGDIIIAQSNVQLSASAIPTATRTPTITRTPTSVPATATATATRTPTSNGTSTRTATATRTATTAPCAPVPAGASSSAFGERIDLSLAGLVQLSSGPLPLVSGIAPPAYNVSDNLASATASGGLTGQILQTGVLSVHAQSTVPTSGFVTADAEVNDLNLDLLGLIDLLGLGADTITSSATITGCAGSFTVTGTSQIEGANLSGPLSTGLSIEANPAPNTELSLLNGALRIILNEQIPGNDQANNPSLTVNAIHVIFNDVNVIGIGLVDGDIIIAQVNVRLSASTIPTPTRTATQTAVPPTATFTRTATHTPLPPTATRTATATRTFTNIPGVPTATFTATAPPATATFTAVPPTATRTATNSPVPATATRTATHSPIPPTATFTRTSTSTPIPPTATRTATATRTFTNVPGVPTATFTATAPPATATFTAVPPTATQVPPTATRTVTSSPVPPTATFTRTASNTPIPPTATRTATATRTSTDIPGIPTATFTVTAPPATATFTALPPTATQVPPTATRTATSSPVPPTATFTRTATNTPILPTPTRTATATRTFTNVPGVPTATFTATAPPATATFTAVPPTATAVPPTATRTATTVPNQPTATFTAALPPATATFTSVPVPPTATATTAPLAATATPVDDATPTHTATAIAGEPTATHNPPATATSTAAGPTATATVQSVATSTATSGAATPTATRDTSIGEGTPTPTETDIATVTPTATLNTTTPTAEITSTPTATPTRTTVPPTCPPAVAQSEALGGKVDLIIVPLDGIPIVVKTDLLSSNDTSPPAFSRNERNASMQVSAPNVGSLLSVGEIMTSIFGSEEEHGMASASATVNDLNLNLAGLFSFLETDAAQIASNAHVEGTCCTSLEANGTSTVGSAFLSCMIGDGVTLPANPEPNTEIIHDLGIHTVLNEQIVEGDGSADMRLTVNAMHITLQQVLITGLGSVSGEVILGHSVAGLSCNGFSCGTCAGDCDGNCDVTIEEIVTGVNIALDRMPVSMCRPTDINNTQSITVDELVTVVQNFLYGCPATRE